MAGVFMNEGSVQAANTKLEAAIEDLRIKYESKAAREAESAAAAAAAERVKGMTSDEVVAQDEAARENDWSVEDPELELLRQARMAALKSRAGAEKTPRVPGAGELREILEADFLREVTGCRGCVVHFYHAEFTTCAVMDKHLRELAAACPATRFLRIDASKAPFFVTKLRVQVLPTLVLFVDGVAVGRQTGFEELGAVRSASAAGGGTAVSRLNAGSAAGLGGVDDFATAALRRRLQRSGVLGGPAAAAGDDSDEDGDGDGTGDAVRRGGGSGGNSGVGRLEALRAARVRDESYADPFAPDR